MSRRSRRRNRKRGARQRKTARPRAVEAPAAVEPADLSVELGEAVADADLPRCAIVILNLDGKHHLEPCFSALRALDYPEDRVEVILIDNASTDGSVEAVERDHSWVRLVENDTNVGFSSGCNQGADLASDADVLVFLNNDMRVEPSWLRELVSPIARGECCATTARMYSWDGKLMNSAGGGMNFHGIGIQRGYLEEPGPSYEQPRKTLFACGGAMAMDAQVFEQVGGFDDEYFAYYEDVDLGWRTWLAGKDVWYVPTAECYHHHSSTSGRLPPEMIRVLQVRNPMLTCFKNYSDENLKRILPAMLGLAMRRMFLVSGLQDDTPFRIEHAGRGKRGRVRRAWDKARTSVNQAVPVRKVSAADMIGVNDLLGRWEHWMARRREVQGLRRRSDRELFSLFLRPQWCVEDEPAYGELQAGLTEFCGIDELFTGLSEAGPEPNK
ncbi:MAG: glycosyltransferase family 2 protein [Planctomycetota bacterium]|nr:glycosyltransferase family 2 protein [Planctomycetota bacterium]MDP6761772.1 glycosyltransferase family 2 protein [Planctomycetota bacterium]MDP6988026.1 glycosyltransferase family 2 protein [Planctomycetota bacterium]